MKIEIPESLRPDIDAAITTTNEAADSLRGTQLRIEEIEAERHKSINKHAAAGALEIPSQEQVTDILVEGKRTEILDKALVSVHQQLDAQKRAAIREITDAHELFRRGAAKPLTEEAKRQLLESLPPSVKANGHLVFSVWAGSAENRACGMFLNPLLPSRRDDTETILAEAERIVALLRELVTDGEVSMPVASYPAAF